MSNNIPAEFPVARFQDVSRLGNKSMTCDLTLSEEERAAVIEAYDLLGLEDVKATFELRPWRKDGVAVRGQISALVVQRCVVTLGPVDLRIDENFERHFKPEADQKANEVEIEIEYELQDPPDPLEKDVIDLGALFCEHLALALDPYPRAKGALLPSGVTAEDEEGQETVLDSKPSPFAVLAKLKGGNDETSE